MYISPIVQCHRHRNNPYQQGTSKFDKYIGSYCYPDRLFKTSYVSPLFFQLNGNHIYVFQIVNEHSYKITQNYVFFPFNLNVFAGRFSQIVLMCEYLFNTIAREWIIKTNQSVFIYRYSSLNQSKWETKFFECLCFKLTLQRKKNLWQDR
jgi:hypothetical protein